jgi:CubicO group peptidase (beta-lactamase class C family)
MEIPVIKYPGVHKVALLLGLTMAAATAIAADRPSASQTAAERADAVIRALPGAVEIVGRTPSRVTLADAMKAAHVSGVAIVVIHHGRIDWSRGFGVTRSGGEPVTSRTLFQAGSISKTIATVAALRLVQAGRLSLDTDVNATLTSWTLPSNAFTSQTPVTLRALLSHTAGTTVHGFPGYAAGTPLPTLVQILNGTPPANSKPVIVDQAVGSAYRYSGGGYTVAQQLMLDVTHVPFADLVRQTVLEPMGMHDSTETQPLDAARLAHVAQPYDEQGVPIEGGPHVYPELAAAGLWSTADDLARFAIALRSASKGEAGGVLAPAMVQAMMTPVKSDYGLGLETGGSAQAPYVSHDGATEGYRATMFIYPGSGDGVVVLTNGDGGFSVIEKVVRAVAVVYGWPDKRPESLRAIALPEKSLDGYVGTFTAQDFGDFVVRREGDQLVAAIEKGKRTPLYAESSTRFFATDERVKLHFDDNDKGSYAFGGYKGWFRRVAPK